MAMTARQKIIRFLTPVILPIVKIYWGIFKPETYGVKVIIENNGKFLLVRNAYGSKRWTFPGGRIEKNEAAIAAAAREIREEVQLNISNLIFIDQIVSTSEGKRDNVSIFRASSESSEITSDEFEIEEAGWFAPENFPEISLIAEKIWQIYKNKNSTESNS